VIVGVGLSIYSLCRQYIQLLSIIYLLCFQRYYNSCKSHSCGQSSYLWSFSCTSQSSSKQFGRDKLHSFSSRWSMLLLVLFS